MTEATHSHKPDQVDLDLREKGAPKEGVPQYLDRRLYFQFLAFQDCKDPQSLIPALQACPQVLVLYQNLNHPFGIGILLNSEDPTGFVSAAQNLFRGKAFENLTFQPEFTMTGRTYTIGREQDLEHWLLKKPKMNALNPAWPWAIWYPLRRKPEFATLTREAQGKLMAEHAFIGHSYASISAAYDIRLNCFGLDKNDNEFIIGLVGPELYPLTRVVQDMRKTEQTSKYIQSLGPFFVGKVIWQRESGD